MPQLTEFLDVLMAHPKAQTVSDDFREDLEYLKHIIVRLQEELPKVQSLGNGPIHGDVNGLNHKLHRSPEGKLEGVTLFDTDLSKLGPQEYDLATLLWSGGLLGDTTHPSWDSFIAGYKHVRPDVQIHARDIHLYAMHRHLCIVHKVMSDVTRELDTISPENHIGFIKYSIGMIQFLSPRTEVAGKSLEGRVGCYTVSESQSGSSVADIQIYQKSGQLYAKLSTGDGECMADVPIVAISSDYKKEGRHYFLSQSHTQDISFMLAFDGEGEFEIIGNGGLGFEGTRFLGLA